MRKCKIKECIYNHLDYCSVEDETGGIFKAKECKQRKRDLVCVECGEEKCECD